MVVEKKIYSVRIILYPDADSCPYRSSKRPAALTNPRQVLDPTSSPCLALIRKTNSHRTPHNITSSAVSVFPGFWPSVCLPAFDRDWLPSAAVELNSQARVLTHTSRGLGFAVASAGAERRWLVFSIHGLNEQLWVNSLCSSCAAWAISWDGF